MQICFNATNFFNRGLTEVVEGSVLKLNDDTGIVWN